MNLEYMNLYNCLMIVWMNHSLNKIWLSILKLCSLFVAFPLIQASHQKNLILSIILVFYSGSLQWFILTPTHKPDSIVPYIPHQIIATKPLVGHPKMEVKSKGIPQNAWKHSSLGIIGQFAQMDILILFVMSYSIMGRIATRECM